MSVHCTTVVHKWPVLASSKDCLVTPRAEVEGTLLFGLFLSFLFDYFNYLLCLHHFLHQQFLPIVTSVTQVSVKYL